MFNLSEAWKRNYEAYLAEEYNNFDETFKDTFAELEESQKEVESSLDIINEYFKLYALSEGVLTEASEMDPEDDNKKNKTGDDVISALIKKSLENSAKKAEHGSDLPVYSVVGTPVVEKIGDMKFPQNVFFFIRQIVDWIKRVVIYIVEKIKNLFRVVMGEKPVELNKEYIKLRLEREKDLVQVRTIGDNSNKVVKAYKLDPKDLSVYQALKEEKVELIKKPEEKSPIVVTIDLSKELLSLRQLAQHYFDLFDEAYGSNHEHLFDTEDLEIILKIFKDAIKGIKTGETPTYEVGGRLAEVSAVSSERIKENLIRTKINTEKLGAAYVQTASMINDVARIINSKELLMTKDMGIAFRWLTATTLSQMLEILACIKPRLKQAEKLYRNLGHMQQAYGKISAELQRMQGAVIAISNITYSSSYQRKIEDLFMSSKFMTQLVALRLTALGTYIKELKDIKNIINMLAVLNDK